MIGIKDFSFKKDFTRNIVTLFSGNGLAQAFNLIGTLFIYPRIFTPTDFGYLAVFMSIAMILAVFSTGRYEQAIVLPEKNEDAINVLALSSALVILFSIGTFILIGALLLFVPQMIYLRDLGFVSLLVPLAILFYGLTQTLNFWMVRTKRFGQLSTSKVAESLMAFIVTVLAGYYLSWQYGLILGFLAGTICAFAWLAVVFFRHYFIELKIISRSEIRNQSARYKDFPRYNMFQVLFDMLQRYGSVFIIERFYGYAILGNCHLVYRALRGPLALLGGAFGQVFLQKASESYNLGQNYPALLKKSIAALSLVSLPIFLFLFFFVEDILNLILGQGFEYAGRIAVIIVPWMAFNFISSPVSSFPIILGKQLQFLILTTIGNFIGLGSLLMAAVYGLSHEYAISVFSLAMTLLMIAIIAWNFYIVNRTYRSRKIESPAGN